MDINLIAKSLEQTGYIVLEQALPQTILDKLLHRCKIDDTNRFNTAHVGRGNDKRLLPNLRGDVISWLDEQDIDDQTFLAAMDKLRQELNARLYLGLFDYECHYAIYESGTGYAKHLDVLHGKKNRILSTVLYLNENWQQDDGGELDVYDENGSNILTTVAPRFGTLIIFLSEHFPHEVRCSNITRRSIAGWFRVSGSSPR